MIDGIVKVSSHLRKEERHLTIPQLTGRKVYNKREKFFEVEGCPFDQVDFLPLFSSVRLTR